MLPAFYSVLKGTHNDWHVLSYLVGQGKGACSQGCLYCQNEIPGAQTFALQNDRADTVTISLLLGCLV